MTVRLRRDIPSLRAPDMSRIVVGVIRQSETASFRITHFSIMRDHLHLIVEADGKLALAGGMHSLEVRVARRINGYVGRIGPLFIDRYHARALQTPREVRNGIAYVLRNWHHHEPGAAGVDLYSSARWFYGVEDANAPVAPAQSWLGAMGWRRAGPIPPG